MLSDVQPNPEVTGGAISGNDPSAILMVNQMMDRVFDMVQR